MPGQPLTGERASTPKFVELVAQDNGSVLSKKMGNGHITRYLWAETVTVSGTEYTIASGISYNGKAFATYANVVVTPRELVTDNYYVDYNTTTNVVKLVSSGSINADFNIQIVLA